MTRKLVRRVHLAAALTATAIILTFWVSTVTVELFGSADDIVAVKRAIAWALIALVPALATAGATGFRLAGAASHPRILAKKRRMPVIAGIGLLVLAPSALYLAAAGSAGDMGPRFALVQAVELLAGGTNLTLMALNIRDGLRMSGRWARTSSRPPSSPRPRPRTAPRRPSAAG